MTTPNSQIDEERKQQDIIALAKQAGFKDYYGCKSRHNKIDDDCPCDASGGDCTQNELIGFRLPIENLSNILKFAELLLATKIDIESQSQLSASPPASDSITLLEAQADNARLRELLIKASESIKSGFESNGMLEAEFSVNDKKLSAEIDKALSLSSTTTALQEHDNEVK